MRFRLGIMAGFAAGYYLGARAGRERFDEINRTLERIRRSEAIDAAADRARAAVDLGFERAKDVIEERLHVAPFANSGDRDVEPPWPAEMDPVVRP